MINKKSVALLLAIAATGATSPALAQTLEAYGPVLPMRYDHYGARHFYMYGYSGPFAPPMPSPAVAPSGRRERQEKARISRS